MRLHVELEDGKAETVFVPAAALREAMNAGLEDIDVTCYVAWWAMHRRGLTDCADWEEFSLVAAISQAEDTDPKA